MVEVVDRVRSVTCKASAPLLLFLQGPRLSPSLNLSFFPFKSLNLCFHFHFSQSSPFLTLLLSLFKFLQIKERDIEKVQQMDLMLITIID